jgi:hypothetical protein
VVELSKREVLRRYLHNDVRNLADIHPLRQDLMQRCLADFARHYVEAMDFGDAELLREAEGNLRLAVKQNWA